MSLATERSGRGRRLALTHGFTQNSQCWGPVAGLLAEHHEVVRIDAPGHGRSGHDDADLWASADLLGEAGGQAIYVGYSMGGRMSLHLALSTPELVDGLILIGATPGIEDRLDRDTRLRADAVLAKRLLTDGLDSFLDRWLTNPLFASLPPDSAAKNARLTNRPEGLAASLHHRGTGSQESLWSRLPDLTMPVLIIVGRTDHKFLAIGEQMVTAMSGTDAELVSIPGTHAVHLERPDRVATIIAERAASW